jgi:hypothetical protein
MKNLKLTQSLNQNVGIEIEETGTQARNTWGPNLKLPKFTYEMDFI